MAKRSKSRATIPFAVFAILLVAIIGFHLQKQQGNDSVLGITSGAPLFSKEWFGEILGFFGLGEKKTTTTVNYSLPTYSGSQKSNGFSITGNEEPDTLLVELESTSDDGGESEFESLEEEASGL